jgi:hypothetical protein
VIGFPHRLTAACISRLLDTDVLIDLFRGSLGQPPQAEVLRLQPGGCPGNTPVGAGLQPAQVPSPTFWVAGNLSMNHSKKSPSSDYR